jgi:hypothetical protein
MGTHPGSAVVSAERRLHLWDLVVQRARGSPPTADHVGHVAVGVSGVDGVAIAVTLAASPRETLSTSDQVAADLEDMMTTLGEGPGVDALTGAPALAADLGDSYCQARWPIFAPAAAELGVRALFALPLQVGGIRLGAMDLYRAAPGPLGRGQLADALLLADTACALLLDQATVAGLGRRPEGASLQHPEVHQATGMIIAQLGVGAALALVRLRAYAYASGLPLRDVAASVVARRLRFRHDTETTTDQDDNA